MNKAELIDRVAQKTKCTKSQSEIILDAAIEVIQKAVADGEEVKIVGFGTFTRIEKKARRARNPKTGAEVHIPAAQAPRFRPGKEFRDQVR